MAIAVPYLNENSLINYPLAQDQDVPEIVRRLIVDAGITFCMPFYCTPVLKSVEITLSDVVITLGSLESLDPFATITAADLRFYSVGGHWNTARVLGDCGEEPSGTGENQYYLSPTICVVVDENVIDETRADGYSWNGSLLFDPHVISYEPLRFEKLILENYQKDPIEIYPTSYRQIWFKGGHNVAIGPTDDGIVISANPGSGEGKVPCECEEDTGNGLSGNVQVVGDGCLSIEPSPADSHTLIIHDSCVACCQCSQYVDKVDTLRGLANELSGVGASIRANIDKLNEEITKFNQQECKGGDGQWIEILSAAGNDPGPKGRARVHAVLSITNMTCQPGWVTMELPSPYESLLYFIMEIGGGRYADIEPDSTFYVLGVQPGEDPGDQPSDIAGKGLPYLVKVKPGETLKVHRTFIMPSTHIQPFPWNGGFSGTVKTKGMIRLSPECNPPWQPDYKNFDFKKDLAIQ